MASDPTVAFTDDELWAVNHDGGPHCGSRSDILPAVGCLLAVGHDGPHIPGSDELIAKGVRLIPLVSFQ
jgi:hypothetical protein